MFKINSQEDLDVFLAIFKLPECKDAFISECHLLAPTYIDSDDHSIVAYASEPTMRILVCMPNSAYPGLELIFKEVEWISLAFGAGLKPLIRRHHERIYFSFLDSESSNIIAKSLHYRILGNDCWGWNVRYSTENIFDDRGSLLIANL